MNYRVIILPPAERDIRKLPKDLQQLIIARAYSLQTDPRPHSVKKLKGEEGYRIRVGDYRIVYDIEDAIKVVSVTRVKHSKDVYR